MKKNLQSIKKSIKKLSENKSLAAIVLGILTIAVVIVREHTFTRTLGAL